MRWFTRKGPGDKSRAVRPEISVSQPYRFQDINQPKLFTTTLFFTASGFQNWLDAEVKGWHCPVFFRLLYHPEVKMIVEIACAPGSDATLQFFFYTFLTNGRIISSSSLCELSEKDGLLEKRCPLPQENFFFYENWPAERIFARHQKEVESAIKAGAELKTVKLNDFLSLYLEKFTDRSE